MTPSTPLVDQPTYPNIPADFKTLWAPLAPHLGGHGAAETVGGGPVRLIALALAGGIGWFSLRWRQRPEMIVWAAALALALRVYTESVMTAYYTWPALALGVVIACRATTWRFWAAVAAAVGDHGDGPMAHRLLPLVGRAGRRGDRRPGRRRPTPGAGDGTSRRAEAPAPGRIAAPYLGRVDQEARTGPTLSRTSAASGTAPVDPVLTCG